MELVECCDAKYLVLATPNREPFQRLAQRERRHHFWRRTLAELEVLQISGDKFKQRAKIVAMRWRTVTTGVDFEMCQVATLEEGVRAWDIAVHSGSEGKAVK